jgi:hypothetical protein
MKSLPDRWNLSYALIGIMMITLLPSWWSAAQQVEIVPYSEFEQPLADGRIERETLDEADLATLKRQLDPAIGLIHGPDVPISTIDKRPNL